MRRFLSGMVFLSTALCALPAVAQVSAETALLDRCAVPDDVSVFSRSSIKFPQLTAVMSAPSLTGTGNPPSLMVDGWKPAPGPADKLLETLGKEAGFTVVGAKDLPITTWRTDKAPLRETIDTLAKAGNVSWSFVGSTLTLSKPVPVATSYRADLPANRDARLAFVDVLRGNGADVSIDRGYVSITGSVDDIGKARTALQEARQILVFDVLFMRGRPDAGRYNWNALGMSSSMVNNAGGQFSTSLNPSDLVSRLEAQGDIQQDSGQTVGAPTGWAVAVPPAQCGLGYGEIIVSPKFDGEKIQAKVSGNGFSADYPSLALGSSMVVAAPQPREGWIDLVFIRPRVVAFSN